MGTSYGFFNSRNGDRKYDADDLSDFFMGLVNNGVLAKPSSSALKVTTAGGLNVQIAAGRAFINAKYFYNDGISTISVPAADETLPRIDRIVLRLDYSARKISIETVAGTPAVVPIAPTLTRTSAVYELSLATIFVSAGTTAIKDSDITDDRPNGSVCGFVTGFSDLGGLSFYRCTQAQYDAMSDHDGNTIYIIVG